MPSYLTELDKLKHELEHDNLRLADLWYVPHMNRTVIWFARPLPLLDTDSPEELQKLIDQARDEPESHAPDVGGSMGRIREPELSEGRPRLKPEIRGRPETAHRVRARPLRNYYVNRMNQADWAEDLARKLLEIPLPRRWAHVRGVAARARTLDPILGEDAAWLHDIGYSPELVETGFHPFDGARYLRDVPQANAVLCSLVAHHSYAVIEAEERGLADELRREFPPASPALSDALAYCVMTTGPSGNLVSVRDRLSEIRERYGPHSTVTRFMHKAEPCLLSSVARTDYRLRSLREDRRLSLV